MGETEFSLPLITKYRPSSWDEMIGNSEIIGALQRRLSEASRPHAFLFTGPSGTGKTTLARIVAAELGCEVVEIDAATNNGVDAMRELVALGNYRALSGAGARMFIIDEAHMLSRSAFNSILKMMEEPPEFLFIALCTTEFQKIIPTIVQRCFHVALRPVRTQDIVDLLSAIAECEGWNAPAEIIHTIAVASNGSPRKAISLLQTGHDISDKDELKRVLRITEDNDPIMELLRLLVSGQTNWPEIQRLLNMIEPDVLEDAATLAGRYVTGAVLNAATEKAARSAWVLLDALVFPADTYDRKVSFVAAIGRMLWGGAE